MDEFLDLDDSLIIDKFFEIKTEDDDETELIEKIKNLQIDLEDVRRRKDELLKKRDLLLNSNISDLDCTKKKFILRNYFTPYIEHDGLSAPQLITDRQISEFRQEAILSTYFSLKSCDREFTLEEQNIVLGQTCSQLSKKRLSSLIRELDSLSDEYYRTQDEKIEKKLQELNFQIEQLKDSKIRPERFDNEIDWTIIASNIGFNLRRSALSCKHYYDNYLCPSVNKNSWTEEENLRLIDLFNELGNDWEEIANKLGNGRLAWQCCKQYQSLLNPDSIKLGKFDLDEKKKIYHIIDKSKYSNGEINWNLVRVLCDTRSVKQIKSMWYNDQIPVTIKKYSKLEDKMIIVGNKIFRDNWITLAKYFPDRKNKQLRERFINHLNFDSRKLAYWTPEENNKLIELAMKCRKTTHQELIDIAKIQREHFPNRNLHQVYRRCLSLFDNGAISENPRFRLNKYIKGSQSSWRMKNLQKNADERTRIQAELPSDQQNLKELFLACHEILVNQFIKSSRMMTNREMKRFYDSFDSVLDLNRQLYDGFTEQEIDNSLTIISNLSKYRCKPKYHMHDENSCEILAHAILELVDLTLLKNLNSFCKIQTFNFEQNSWSTRECMKYNGTLQNAISSFPFIVDSARFYLSNYSFGLLYKSDFPHFNISFIMPNFSTLYAYNALQAISNGLIVQLCKENNHEKMLKKEKQSEKYKNLRQIFFSFLTLPALMSTSVFNKSKIAKILNEKQIDCEQPFDCEQSQELSPVKQKQKGRPAKKKLNHLPDKFFRVRSIKHKYQMKNQIQNIGHEQERFEELLEKSQKFSSIDCKWTDEPRENLLKRASMFLEFIEKTVDQKQKELSESKKNIDEKVGEKMKIKRCRKVVEKASSTSCETATVLRRSLRSNKT